MCNFFNNKTLKSLNDYLTVKLTQTYQGFCKTSIIKQEIFLAVYCCITFITTQYYIDLLWWCSSIIMDRCCLYYSQLNSSISCGNYPIRVQNLAAELICNSTQICNVAEWLHLSAGIIRAAVVRWQRGRFSFLSCTYDGILEQGTFSQLLHRCSGASVTLRVNVITIWTHILHK